MFKCYPFSKVYYLNRRIRKRYGNSLKQIYPSSKKQIKTLTLLFRLGPLQFCITGPRKRNAAIASKLSRKLLGAAHLQYTWKLC